MREKAAFQKRFSIVKAELDDVKKLVEAETLCEKKPRSPQTIKRDLQLPNAVLNLIVSENRSVEGYVSGGIVLDEFEIHSLGINPRFRRMGLATRLLHHTIKEVVQQRVKRIFLEVRRSNVAAQNLYKRCGFEFLQERKSYYHDGEDALVMVRETKDHSIYGE